MPSPVKQLALEHHIPVLQPPTLRNEDAQAELAALNPDLLVVVAYGLILPQVVLDIPRLGCINSHASCSRAGAERRQSSVPSKPVTAKVASP